MLGLIIARNDNVLPSKGVTHFVLAWFGYQHPLGVAPRDNSVRFDFFSSFITVGLYCSEPIAVAWSPKRCQ